MITTLYQKDQKGKLRSWSIWVQEDFTSLQFDVFEIITESGLVDGKKVSSTTPISEGLGGKSIQEQAEADMQTEIAKKLKDGYVSDQRLAKERHETATIPKPSKGHVYHPTGRIENSYTLDRAKFRGIRAGIQKKLDGWRFRVFVPLEGDCIFYTSSGDVSLSFPQIEMELKEAMRNIGIRSGLTECFFDGEIYNHKLGYNATASACGTTVHITPEKQALRDAMSFHIFDIISPMHNNWTYDQRYKSLYDMYATEEHYYDFLSIVQMEIVERISEDVIQDRFLRVLSEGYEGLIIRDLSRKQEFRKSTQFLKYKPVVDDEFQIVDFKESIQKNTLGSLVLKLNDSDGTFDCDLKSEIGTDKMKKHIWDNQISYVRKWVTVEFLEYTPDGKPRNPKGKKFRKGMGID